MVLTIPVIVGQDRRLVLDLPANTPIGPAEITLRSQLGRVGSPLTRAAARAALLAAGVLVTDLPAMSSSIPPSEDEIACLGILPVGARPSEALVDEDRGAV
jgi:hypothetical protein